MSLNIFLISLNWNLLSDSIPSLIASLNLSKSLAVWKTSEPLDRSFMEIRGNLLSGFSAMFSFNLTIARSVPLTGANRSSGQPGIFLSMFSKRDFISLL